MVKTLVTMTCRGTGCINAGVHVELHERLVTWGPQIPGPQVHQPSWRA